MTRPPSIIERPLPADSRLGIVPAASDSQLANENQDNGRDGQHRRTHSAHAALRPQLASGGSSRMATQHSIARQTVRDVSLGISSGC